MWIWQQQGWPEFTFDAEALASLLRDVHFNQGQLLGKQAGLGSDIATLDTLLANIIYSSAI
jgi:Fic family protein